MMMILIKKKKFIKKKETNVSYIKTTMKKKRMRYVVTQFWTPRAGDGVYLF
jgi:hypothetical protein